VTDPAAPVRERTTRLIDPDLVEASRILHGALVRVHPSFRFEERLAGRLAEAAGRVTLAGTAWQSRPIAEPVLFPIRDAAAAASGAMLSSRPLGRGGNSMRRTLIGGAIASGMSLAGAAFLVRRWRRAGRAAERAEHVARQGVA
jgi:hypothetical protein